MSEPRGPTAAGTLRIGSREVARLGFGAMRILGDDVWGEPSDADEAKRVLRRAIELGITFVDTAHSYGPEVDERLIAEALYPYPEELVIATKSGWKRPGPKEWLPDGRPETIRADCERSLQLLRVERLDVLYLHTVDPDVPVEESVGTLAELQREGKVDQIGLSNVDVDELARSRAIVDVACVQNRYNILERTGEDVLEVCERDGLPFVPWFPLGAGAAGRLRATDQVAERLGATRYQVAIAWLLRRSPVMLPIPGTSSVEHLEENVAAASLELSDDDVAALSALGDATPA